MPSRKPPSYGAYCSELRGHAYPGEVLRFEQVCARTSVHLLVERTALYKQMPRAARAQWGAKQRGEHFVYGRWLSPVGGADGNFAVGDRGVTGRAAKLPPEYELVLRRETAWWPTQLAASVCVVLHADVYGASGVEIKGMTDVYVIAREEQGPLTSSTWSALTSVTSLVPETLTSSSWHMRTELKSEITRILQFKTGDMHYGRFEMHLTNSEWEMRLQLLADADDELDRDAEALDADADDAVSSEDEESSSSSDDDDAAAPRAPKKLRVLGGGAAAAPTSELFAVKTAKRERRRWHARSKAAMHRSVERSKAVILTIRSGAEINALARVLGDGWYSSLPKDMLKAKVSLGVNDAEQQKTTETVAVLPVDGGDAATQPRVELEYTCGRRALVVRVWWAAFASKKDFEAAIKAAGVVC